MRPSLSFEPPSVVPAPASRGVDPTRPVRRSMRTALTLSPAQQTETGRETESARKATSPPEVRTPG
jgi:hypothetical protein